MPRPADDSVVMLHELPGEQAAEQIRDGRITSVELVTACIECIGETDREIGAWASFDPDVALASAREMDDLRMRGRPLGPLHGVPVGIKDVYDTAEFATAWGSQAHAERQPGADCAVADKLREAGAVLIGKTVTTELMFAGDVATRNPHNTARGSGGSSAGSAAAIAAGHVPLAIASQTNGSVIRPASFCGVYGFKPTRGLISRRGCLATSQTLDQVGVMGRSLGDVALLGDALAGYDPGDPATHRRPKPGMFAASKSDPPVEPAFVWFELDYLDRVSSATRGGFDEVMEALNGRVERLPAPRSFGEVLGAHKTVHEYEFRRNMEQNPEIDETALPEAIAAVLERAGHIEADTYTDALALLAGAEDYFATFFNDYDAILTPAALGEAPLFGDGIGDPICSTIWTFAGLPCLTIPWLKGESGLPAGIQLVGSAQEDDRLLRTAAWLERHLAGDAVTDA